jgi:hypothetical protein
LTFGCLALIRSGHSGGDCATQVLSRDLRCPLAARPIRISEFALPRIATGRFRCSAYLVRGLGQQLVPLSSLLGDDREPNGGTSGRAVGCGRVAPGEGCEGWMFGWLIPVRRFNRPKVDS